MTPCFPLNQRSSKKKIKILYSEPRNRSIFSKKLIISADKRRKNLGEVFKPTVPRQFPVRGPYPARILPMQGQKIRHVQPLGQLTSFVSPWDGQAWRSSSHWKCSTENVIYVLKCNEHPNNPYISSARNLKKRLPNHKSDIKVGKTGNKCAVLSRKRGERSSGWQQVWFSADIFCGMSTNPDLLHPEVPVGSS